MTARGMGWVFVVSMVVLAGASASLADRWFTDVAWEVAYDGSVLPQNAPVPWTRELVGGHITDNSDGDILTVDTSGDKVQRLYYNILNNPSYDVSGTSTVEFRARVTNKLAGTNFPFACTIADGTYRTGVNLSDASIYIAGQWFTNIRGDEWHVYRMTYDNGTINVYVDNDTNPLKTFATGGPPDTNNGVEFGDRSPWEGRTFEVDYVCFTTQEAAVPVPEPMTLSLLALGGLAVLRRRS